MQEIFDDYVANAFGEARQSDEKMLKFDRNYRRHFPASADARVLDVGIGRGEMLTSARRWGYKSVLGVDISPSTVAFCRSIGLDCECVPDSTAWLEGHPAEFDVITLFDVLEHVPKQATIGFLKSLHQALKPGGSLIIQVPNLQAPDAQLHRYNDITHEVGYVEHSLQQVLHAAGFRRFEFHGFEDFVDESWTARGLSHRAQRVLRAVYWRWVRFLRGINSNLNPRILNPVLVAVVKR